MPGKKTDFDPKKTTVSDLKHQPIAVIKTEVPALAKALGIKPEELFRSMTGFPDLDISEPTCCALDAW
jgi:hypothetical protein